MRPANGKANRIISQEVANKHELDINSSHIIIGTSTGFTQTQQSPEDKFNVIL